MLWVKHMDGWSLVCGGMSVVGGAEYRGKSAVSDPSDSTMRCR